MTAYRFKGILQKEKWISPAYVQLDKSGNISAIQEKAEVGIKYTNINGYAIPGLQNAHSHAFQYAMVGLTERHQSDQQDDFWGWRRAMYQLALSVNPDQMEAIAAMLYMEMLRHGYTEVAEFHYVHHSISGQRYDNLAELGERLIAAAKQVGIKITLVPMFYQKGGFGKNIEPNQKRFFSKDIEGYLELLAASEQATKAYEAASLACGIHSLRAVEPTLINPLIAQLNTEIPFHLHIAEQLKEVEQSIDYLGKRPVEWLTENVELNDRFHLVHATHLTDAEVTDIADSKANVILCPSTEGNLGDGIFPLKTFQKAGGNWSIGTDSHIGLNPFEELRILDYGQRLTSHQRNTFTNEQQGDSGLYALNKLVTNGRKAMGKQQNNYFEKGKAFDALVLDAKHPILAVCSKENLASTIVYAADVSMHLGTMVNGQWVIKKGKHAIGSFIQKHFKQALKKLKTR